MPQDAPASENRPSRPLWSQVLRALREASGVTQDGWAAELGIGRTTLQRWETGQAVPDGEAQEAVVAQCERRSLFRRYESGPLQGVTLTPELLREMLTEARLGTQRTNFATPVASSDAPATPPPIAEATSSEASYVSKRGYAVSPLILAAIVFVVALVAVGGTAYALTRRNGSDGGSPGKVSIASIAAERPDGFISFASDDNGKAAVYAINFDGSGLALVMDSPLFDSEPRWSPDGKRVAFTSRSTGNRDIFITPLGEGEPLQLTNDPSDDLEPAWSPDGSLIAFTSGRAGSKNIFVMTPTGVVQDQLTNEASDDFHPTWSPDGTQIAFASTRDGNREIYVMNADGSDVQRLTDHAGDDDQPAWSPDGTQIAFQSRRDGNREIYVMNADGTGLRRLTNDPKDDRQPSWSPDGAYVAFVSTRDGNREVYVVRADGTGLRRLTESPPDKDQPTWVSPATQ